MSSASLSSTTTAQPIVWAKALPYERVEFVAKIHQLLDLKLLRRDALELAEVETFYASAGLAPQSNHVLCLRGRASVPHEAIFLKLVRRIRQTLLSDFDVDLQFGTYAGDAVPPGILVQPLTETGQYRAMRYWHRAFWAMRCGIVKKIADTRALTQHRVKATTGGAASSAAQRHRALYTGAQLSDTSTANSSVMAKPKAALKVPKEFAPMSVYHFECSTPCLALDRLMMNAPTLIVVWATWDSTSVDLLQNVFFRGPPSAGSLGEDYWVAAVRQYVRVAGPVTSETRAAGNVGSKARSTTTPQQVSLATTATDAGSPAASAASLTKRANLLLVNVDTDKDVGTLTLGNIMRRGALWKSSEVSFSSLWCGPEGLQSSFAAQFNVVSLPTVVGCDTAVVPGQRPVIRAVDDGARLQKKPIASSMMPMLANNSCRLSLPHWHDVPRDVRCKLHAHVAAVIAANDAPLVLRSTVCTVFPPPSECMDAAVRSRARSIVAAPVADAGDDGGVQMPTIISRSSSAAWVALPDAGQTAAVVPYSVESDLASLGVRESTLSLHGTCCALVADQLSNPVGGSDLDVLAQMRQVRNATIGVVVFPPSSPLQITFDALTAEHRVKKMYCNVTCRHCRAAVRTDKEAHFRCLHCPDASASLCTRCYENRAHTPSHVCVKLPADVKQKVVDTSAPPPLWGTSNVAMLPTIQGRLVPSITNAHHDTFCNGCKSTIIGERWKCCCCHEFDLCSRCEAVWWQMVAGSGTTSLSPRGGVRASKTAGKEQLHSPSLLEHPPSHYFMHVRCAVPGDAGLFLQPKLCNLSHQ